MKSLNFHNYGRKYHLWAVCNRDGFVHTPTLAPTEKESIELYLKFTRYYQWYRPWEVLLIEGYTCNKLDIKFSRSTKKGKCNHHCIDEYHKSLKKTNE